MKIQRTTLILVLIAFALGGFVYLYEIRGKQQQAEIQKKQKQVFDFDSEQIQIITIKKLLETLTLKIDEEAEEKSAARKHGAPTRPLRQEAGEGPEREHGYPPNVPGRPVGAEPSD